METNTINLTTTIASGSSLSGSIDMSAFALNKDNFRLFGIVMPSEWTAANLTFQSSYDGGVTWHDIYKEGSEYVCPALAGKDNDVDFQRFSYVPMLRLRSGTASVPVAQAADRSVRLVLRSV